MKKILRFCFVLLLIGLPVQAQNTGDSNPTGNNPLPEYNLLEPLPCVPGGEVTCSQPGAVETKINFKYYVQYMFNLFIAVAAVSSVFMIVYGGLQYMSTDSWQGKKDGLDKVKNAVLGLLLVLTSYIILRTIDPRLVEIPTSLVPPLSIKYEKITDHFFDNLIKEAARSKIDLSAARSELQQSDQRNNDRQSMIEELSAQKAELLSAFVGVDSSDPEIQKIDAQIALLRNEIDREKAGAELIVAKSALDNSGLTLASINVVYELRLGKLKAANAEPDQIQELERHRDFSKRRVTIINLESKVEEILESTLSSSQKKVRLELERKHSLEEIDKIVTASSLATTASNKADLDRHSKIVKQAREAKDKINSLKIE